MTVTSLKQPYGKLLWTKIRISTCGLTHSGLARSIILSNIAVIYNTIVTVLLESMMFYICVSANLTELEY